MAESSSNPRNKKMEMEEIVRHMSNLPSYLERGKPVQDRALNFGVMDWGKLEKWQYQQHQKQGIVKSNKYSPVSSNSSLLFSTDGSSSPHSSRDQISSPTSLKPKHIHKEEIFVKSGTSRNLEKSPDVKDGSVNHSSEKKNSNRSRTKKKDCKLNDLDPRNLPETKSSDDSSFQTASSSSSSKGKMKIQDPIEKTEDVHSHVNSDIRSSYSSENEVMKNKSKNPEEKESNLSDSKVAAIKSRNISPLRRISFNMISKSAAPSTSSQNSTNDNPSKRAHSSPLRRLLDPLFPAKATPPEDPTIKPKSKLDLRSCKEVRVDDSHVNNTNNSHLNNTNIPSSSSTKQALFQMAIKNGRPLFTFAVDDNIDILAATVRSLNGKDEINGWIYTFFTIHEVKKKKKINWLSQGSSNKDISQGYHPNITAQMKVSNPSVSSREFVLSSVDPSPQDELAAIVVKFLRNVGPEENHQDCFGMTVILPGGHHSVPSKGEPSPLIDRWRSGGACDCGGWDMGCRLRTFTNKMHSNIRRLNSREPSKFDLFFQGEIPNERPFFSLSPLKEGIFSVEYNSSSLSLLHAFSICISIIECRKSCQQAEVKTYVAKQVDEEDEASITYASFPPLSLVDRV